jgi:hypothetical protein
MLMRARSIAWLFCWLALGASGCSKHAPVQAPISGPNAPANVDACALLSKEEVEAVVGSPIKETKSSERADGEFRVAQCFYTATEFNKSVNLALVEKNPTKTGSRSPKQFWQETFAPSGKKNEKEETEQEEKKERTPPKKIDGLGDDAYWASNRFGGMLYVLKGDAFISVSIGGADSEEVKIDKCKTLAQKAIGRL